MSAKDVIAVLYADQFGGWDARNSDNEIIAVGGGNPTPHIGETLDQWVERKDAAATREP